METSVCGGPPVVRKWCLRLGQPRLLIPGVLCIASSWPENLQTPQNPIPSPPDKSICRRCRHSFPDRQSAADIGAELRVLAASVAALTWPRK
ncbi:hypothetical protein BKA80DRAFT_261443 [Phyllosticta citrichinensis]